MCLLGLSRSPRLLHERDLLCAAHSMNGPEMLQTVYVDVLGLTALGWTRVWGYEGLGHLPFLGCIALER